MSSRACDLAASLLRIRYGSEDHAVVASVSPARLENCSRHGCLYGNCRFNALRTTRSTSVDEKRARFFKHLVEFFGSHFSNRVKDDVLFNCEKPLRTNETGLIDLAALTIGTIQWNGEGIPVRAAGDLAKNQIRARKIGNHQSRPMHCAIPSRKRNDNDFAGYRFDHAS